MNNKQIKEKHGYYDQHEIPTDIVDAMLNDARKEERKKFMERLEYAIKASEHDYLPRIYFQFTNLKEYMEQEEQS